MLQSIIIKLQSQLQQKDLLSAELWEQLDPEQYLDYRDGADFDTVWIQAYQKLRREGLTDAEHEQVQEWSRIAFDQVLRASGSSELAAYVSDDMDLIFCASLLGLEDEFVNWLAICYTDHRLPA